MLRHEQQTVRMALAALHHSVGPLEKVEMQQNGAPRGQKTAARAREVEEQVTHDGLRALTAPRAVSLSPDRRGATAACGVRQDTLHSRVCHR